MTTLGSAGREAASVRHNYAALRAFLEARGIGGIDEEQLRRVALSCLPALERFDASLLAELERTADEAGLALADVLALNCFLELLDLGYPGGTREQWGIGCSVVGLRAPHGWTIAQNYDVMADYDGLWELRRVSERGVDMALLTMPGVLGCAGMNSAGIGVVINKLTPDDSRPGVPYPAILRAALRMPTLDQAIGEIIRAERASGLHYLIGDAEVLLSIETTAGDYEVMAVDEACFHTNHYLADRLKPLESRRRPFVRDSYTRLARLAGLWREAAPQSAGEVGRLLSDHHCPGASICRHEVGDRPGPASVTVAAVIFELGRGTARSRMGNPCAGEWSAIELAAKEGRA
jgi:isopenicillin-N N-acyltransferase-like protein